MTYNSNKVTESQEFAVLFTKQKAQKRKVWQDGRLRVSGTAAQLHRANPNAGSGDPMLDCCEVINPQEQVTIGNVLEMENFLVTIEGQWTGNTPVSSFVDATRPISTVKVLPKFRRPPARIPPPPQLNAQLPVQFVNRKRPLQPGELLEQYYGVKVPNLSYTVQSSQEAELCLHQQPQYDTIRNCHPVDNQQQYSFSSYSTPSIPDPILPLSKTNLNLNRASSPAKENNQNYNTCGFIANNGFDSARFYGNDEEDDEAVEETGCEKEQETPNPFLSKRNPDHSMTHSSSHKLLGALSFAHAVVNVSPPNGATALSERELLELFHSTNDTSPSTSSEVDVHRVPQQVNQSVHAVAALPTCAESEWSLPFADSDDSGEE